MEARLLTVRPECTSGRSYILHDFGEAGGDFACEEAGRAVVLAERFAGGAVQIDAQAGSLERRRALAALAAPGSVSQLHGVAHLRGHETDRLAALATEINGLGGNCRETEDGLLITAAPLHGGTWHAYADHRMAMAGAIVGLVVPNIEIDDIATTSKTMPEFPQLWTDMLTEPS